MTIEEASRRQLWTALRESIGEPHADTLMTMLPAQPLPELAARDDMAALTATMRSEIRGEGDSLRAEMAERFAGVDGRFAGIDLQFAAVDRQFANVDRQFAELRGEMDTRFANVDRQFAELRGEMDTRFASVDRQFANVDRQFGELRGEIARQLVTLGLSLGSLIIAVLGTILTLGFTGAFG